MERNFRQPTRKMFKQYHHDGTKDLDEWHDIFIEISDPTEYAAALELCGTWKEWLRFKRDWREFAEVIIPGWLEEVEIKIRSEAIKRVADTVNSKDKEAVSSAKWIAEGRYKEKRAGKPSKAMVTREARIQAGIDTETADDIRRVEETVVKFS